MDAARHIDLRVTPAMKPGLSPRSTGFQPATRVPAAAGRYAARVRSASPDAHRRARRPHVVSCPPMRRLARRLFTLCSAVSLLLCVAVCVLWVRSYSGDESELLRYEGEDRLVFPVRGAGYSLRSTGGRLRLGNEHLRLDSRLRSWRANRNASALAPEVNSRRDRVRELRNALRRMNRRDRDFWRGELDRLQHELDSLEKELSAFEAVAFDFPPPRVAAFAYTLPHAVPAVAFAALPGVWLLGRFRRRQRPQTRALPRMCLRPRCATPGRCPECGTEAPPASPAAA